MDVEDSEASVQGVAVVDITETPVAVTESTRKFVPVEGVTSPFAHA